MTVLLIKNLLLDIRFQHYGDRRAETCTPKQKTPNQLLAPKNGGLDEDKYVTPHSTETSLAGVRKERKQKASVSVPDPDILRRKGGVHNA